jgi:hypothetical protein
MKISKLHLAILHIIRFTIIYYEMIKENELNNLKQF